MLQTYQGYFQEGRFVSSEAALISENAKVFVTVAGDGLPPSDIVGRSQRQPEALEKFITAVRSVDNEPLTDKDFAQEVKA